MSYAASGASNTSSDIIVHAEKRGSSEHLDPISPPPKTECEEDILQDCVDLIRDPSPASSDSKVIMEFLLLLIIINPSRSCNYNCPADSPEIV